MSWLLEGAILATGGGVCIQVLGEHMTCASIGDDCTAEGRRSGDDRGDARPPEALATPQGEATGEAATELGSSRGPKSGARCDGIGGLPTGIGGVPSWALPSSSRLLELEVCSRTGVQILLGGGENDLEPNGERRLEREAVEAVARSMHGDPGDKPAATGIKTAAKGGAGTGTKTPSLAVLDAKVSVAGESLLSGDEKERSGVRDLGRA